LIQLRNGLPLDDARARTIFRMKSLAVDELLAGSRKTDAVARRVNQANSALSDMFYAYRF